MCGHSSTVAGDLCPPVNAQALDFGVLKDCQLLEKLLQLADDAVRHLKPGQAPALQKMSHATVQCSTAPL